MTAIDTNILDYEPVQDDSRPRLFTWASVLSCIFIAAMFMLATNDLNATTKWESVTKEQVSNLSVALEGGRTARQLGFLSLGAWGAVAIFLSRRPFRFNGVYLFPLLTLVGWAFLSIVWSNDRGFTAKRLVLLGCVATAIVGFVKQFKLKDLAVLAFVGGCIQLGGSIAFDLLYATGEYGLSGYRFSGLQHPNHSGITAVLLIFGCLYFFDRTRQFRYLAVIGFAALILYLTKSRTSLIACTAAIGTFALLRWDVRSIVMVGLAGLAAIGGFFVFVSMDLVGQEWSSVIHMGREDSQAAAFTGRPMIWAAAMEWLGQDYTRLLLGVGYDSFWTPEAATFVSNRIWFRISEGHCSYFDTLLELGVVGVLCYVYLLVASLIRYARLSWVRDSAGYAFACMIFVFVMVHGLTESTTVDPNFPTFFSFAAFAFLALRSPRLQSTESEVSE